MPQSEFILVDNNVLRPLTKRESAVTSGAYFRQWCDTILNRRRRAFDFLVPPSLGLEYIGLNPEKIPAPKVDIMEVRKLSVAEQICEFERLAFVHYSSLEVLQGRHIRQMAREQLEYVSPDAAAQRLVRNSIVPLLENYLYPEVIQKSLAKRFSQKKDLYADYGIPGLVMLSAALRSLRRQTEFSTHLIAHNLFHYAREGAKRSHPFVNVEARAAYTMPHFEAKGDLVDGEIISYAVTGFPRGGLRKVHVFTTDEPEVIGKRLYLAKGAYLLAIRALLKSPNPLRVRLNNGFVYCVSTDTGAVRDVFSVELLPDWSRYMGI